MGNFCCCKRPSTCAPHSPDQQPTHFHQTPPLQNSTTDDDVPTLAHPQPPKITEPTHLPEITEPDQLHRFIQYIQGLLAAQKSSDQSGPSTSNAGAEFRGHIKSAADTIEKISSETEKFQNSTGDLSSKLPEEARRIVTDGLKGLGNLHWIGVAFSMVAYVLETIHQGSSNREECIQLLERIVEVAKILQKLSNKFSSDESDERHKVEDAVHTIVRGAMICCHYMQSVTLFRYLTAQTVAETLKDTHDNLNKLISELTLLVTMNIQSQQPHRLEQPLNILRISKPVGMKEPFEKVKGLLDMESSGTAKAVIIYGFGGSGKTTLAEYVVSNLALDGLKLCVIRIDENNLDIKKLQEQILSDVGGEKIDLRNYEEGQSRLKGALQGRLCFLVIDNIVDKNHIRDLLPGELCLPSESRILVTSRKNDVREVLPSTVECKEYLVGGLPCDESVELLRQTVLINDESCDEEEERMIKELAKACGGVPLLLSVFGGHIRRDRNKQAYEEALRWLNEGEGVRYDEERLTQKLLHVYHKLKSQYAKDAFLHICAIFHGWQRERVSFIVGGDELKVLQEGALVKISESNEVIVHDVLRTLGIREGKPSRIRSTADFESALDDDEALENIKGIWFDDDDEQTTSQMFVFDSEHLNKMRKSLRVLHLGDRTVLGGQCQCQGRQFKDLRYLQFRNVNTFPFKDASKFEKLTVFINLSEAVCQLELDGLPQTLKVLAISGLSLRESFVVHPSWWRHINNLTNLKMLELSSLTSIIFPQDFVLPASLRLLHFFQCDGFEYLPQGFGQLTSLTDLTLWGCNRLSILPVDFGGLRSLKCLAIEDCESLTELPQGFGQLTSLTHLTLWECNRLSILPLDFGGLRSLECLRIYECESLTELPQGFGQLTSLRHLTLGRCNRLSILPVDFGGLRSLKCLAILDCASLTELPRGFGQLTSLTNLDLTDCPMLEAETVFTLKNLRKLNIRGSSRLKLKWEEMPNKEDFDFVVTYTEN